MFRRPARGWRPSPRTGAACLCAAAALGTAWAPVAHAGLFPAPPTQPPPGALGGDGPCESSVRTLANPADADESVFVFAPAGAAATPLVGGRCDDPQRPTVFLAHGYGTSDPASYQSLIDHLVSVGNIVVFATLTAELSVSSDFEADYRTVDAGHVAATQAEPRIDVTRVGYVGHSFGGGMTPWLVQQAGARSWGAGALWMAPLAPAVSYAVGTGAIPVPGQTRAVIVGFGTDQAADLRLGIDVFESLTIPDDRKQHVTVRTDIRPGFPTPTVLLADHTTPTEPILGGSGTAMKFYGVFRNLDALEACTLGTGSCSTDLSFMGRWSDGSPVRPAISTDDPVDLGPAPALLAECSNIIHNPRWETCPPTRIL
jgi:hypothetical protein